MGESVDELIEFKKACTGEANKNQKGQGDNLRIDDGRMISDGIVLDIGEIKTIQANLENFFREIGIRQIFFTLKHQKLIRGGIAVGKTILGRENTHKEQENRTNHYVSSGLTKAYSIESKEISWPIIATTQSQIIKIQNHIKVKKTFGLKQTFNKDGEKIYFIDFLCDLCDLGKQENYRDFLKSKLDEAKKEKKLAICGKIIWLIKHYQEKNGKEQEQFGLHGVIL